MSLLKWFKTAPEMPTSLLYDESTFYQAFMTDLGKCEKEVVIESPFITCSRMEVVRPLIERLLMKGVKVHIITRDPIEHSEDFGYEATNEILNCVEMGIHVVLLRGNHHRKLAILDRKVLWEGSLNILSQSYSQEVMRRIEGEKAAKDMFRFVNMDKFI